jgi:NAD(P) transhydrogenase subunit alpha
LKSDALGNQEIIVHDLIQELIMKIAVLKERATNESRVALSPETTKAFVKAGFSVWCEKGAGISAGFYDSDYINSGANVSAVPLEIIGDADIILKVQPTPQSKEISELTFAKPKAIIIGILSPFSNMALIQNYAEKNITSFAMELVPRITKAQKMDALSSQSNLVGYRSVIEASYHFSKGISMMTTAAGTIPPARVLVLGAGVAGLQAIATAKRLGAIVSAFDVRQASKEQVESVGAKFLSLGDITSESKDGYARELNADDQNKLVELLATQIVKNDIIISTAQIPGKQAPRLVKLDTVKAMQSGSVIVDTATLTGGNVEGSKRDEVVQIGGTTIIGYSNLASHIPHDSSRLYANNLLHLVLHIFQNGKIDMQDDIVRAMLVTHNNKII